MGHDEMGTILACGSLIYCKTKTVNLLSFDPSNRCGLDQAYCPKA